MSENFAKNSFITSLSQILILAFGVVGSIIIARTLGPAGKGIYSVVLLFSSVLVYFSTLGLGQAAVYYLGKGAYPGKIIFGNTFNYVVILSTVSCLVGVAICYWYGGSLFPSVSKRLLLMAVVLVPPQLFFGLLAPLLLGFHKVLQYNCVQLCRAFSVLILSIVLLVMLKMGIKAAILMEFLTFLLSGVVAFILIFRQSGGMTIRFDKQYLRDSLKYGLSIHSGTILNLLHYRADVFIINLYLNPTVLGLYSVSAGLSEKLSLISDGTATIMVPKISKEKDPEKIRNFTPLVLRTTLLLTFSAAVILFLFSSWLITWIYSAAFAGSVYPFRILIFGAVLFGGFSILEADFKGRGRPILNSVVLGISAITNIVLNILLIPRYGIIGAAYASLATYSASFLVALIIYCKLSKDSLVSVLTPKQSDLQIYKGLMQKVLSKFEKPAISGNEI